MRQGLVIKEVTEKTKIAWLLICLKECVDGGRIAVQVEDKVVRVRNVKLDGRLDGRAEAPGDSRERLLEFGFDYCYWSVNPEAPNYASQEEVFHDLGVSVLAGAAEGYNICLFAYGQTGSGKTYTMMGTPDSTGLTPRICQGLFQSDMDSPDGQNCRIEISFLEIYNERVRDLLRGNDQKKPAPLRVREHPEKGPYVQGLSQHVVSDYKQAEHLLKEGISNRITAATHVHDASSRSHAIFSIQYTQAILENNLPSEIVSKINLVDLAGSERADPHYCRDRITEGANINKSLVTLGIVISALAQNSQMCSSSQSINSMLSEGEGSTVGSHSSSLSSSGRRHCFIPYRDSVLTWLLKDSLGGNSKTIMIATISPSYSSYNETLSTLRYAAHARNIVNKPRVNEDANVRLIRELREEIDRLKSMLLSFSMQRNPSPSLSDERDGSFSDIVLQNEIKVEQLTKDWSDSWRHKRSLLEEYSVDINENRAGVQIHSLLPHLISLEPDVLSTGVTIYHLREGVTRIGPQDQNEEEPHIVLSESSACEIENQNGVVTLRPLPHSICMVNDREVTETCRLAQGAVITVGLLNKFRFNHPAEAAVLRERRRTSEAGLLCDSYFSTFSRTAGTCGLDLSDSPAYRQRLEEQQRYVECLWEKIQVEQTRAEKDLETEQAHLHQQHTEIQQWILQEKQRLTAIRERGTLESGVQTDLVPLPVLAGGNRKALDEGDAETVGPSLIVGVGKQVVQEELLKHHALRRAENRIRRKRLHYQLERIARKRHLLEAKRELQRLENTLSFRVDGPSSAELGSPSKCRGHPLALRRHSFSADLLSRLYPQHTPIFRQFLRRNRSSGSTSSLSEFTCSRKWVSDECLPDQKTRGRSNTMPSRYNQRTSSMMGSSENLKILPKDDGPSGGMTERKTLASNPESSVWNPTGNHNASSQSALDSNNCDRKKVLPIIKQSSTQKSSAKGGKTFAPGRSKGLETIRKALSRSVGSGIKTALSRVFRKPPLGLRGGRGAKSSNREKAQFVGEGNKDNIVGNMETKQQKCFIKTTVSCEGLEHLTSIKVKTQKQRRWHSAEALTNKTKKWVRMQQELTGCVENDEEEIDGSSDCDSLFSVDSLSSAYAIALAEQLQQEECEPSEAENKHRQLEDGRQNIFQSSTPINQSYKSSMLKHNHRLSQDSVKCWSDRSKSHFQYQEEDVVSLAPSECNTDILVSIDPLVETSPLKEDQWIPEDLPVHNKFTNWSGINQKSPARLSNDCNPSMDKSPESNQPYSAESRHKPQSLEGANRKTREIERLRKEREQVLASVRLDMSPQQLSVELTEAKLHYGLGQTDTLLKMLQSSPREESAISAKQQLYDRHRRSIDGLREEREARLQSCRRARSLSPSKHPNSFNHETGKSQRPSDLPSRRKEYLQQLRQEIVQMSRVPDPPRREGHWPSDIELLLRDYSRAREEARTEIARARERLRERTEQEKRRLQQQALAQAVKDDLRRHTRFSNSTLCTGSNLSLSSGPTSGYNSSNAAVLKDRTSPSIQITGLSEVGLRVRTQPPMIPSQSLKAPRAWLSAQDIRLDTSSSGFELLSSSSPSSPPTRQRTFSFGSPSSLSTSYQDIADCTLASAISEVQLASCGDLRNLLAGKAASGWRHQGMERGVQTFHRPSSRPSAHGFLGAVELERPLASLWCLIRDHSKTHLYNESLKSAWTRPLDDSTQLVYLLTDPSNCELKQPRDFCCLSTESKQDDMWVLAIQSVFEESLPRPSVDTVRGEMLPSAWILQPSQRQGQNVVIVIYLLQVDLGTPSLPQRLLSTVARKQAAVIADLDSFFSFS
ncbi:hypothetical protein AOLI_G00123870 [Acnodon oligacanthus]